MLAVTHAWPLACAISAVTTELWPLNNLYICTVRLVLNAYPAATSYVSCGFNFCPPANCSNPTLPVDGSIEPYQNTTEGAVIFFRCNQGFVPAGRMTAVCGTDGRWNPDAATLVCTCEHHINLHHMQSVAVCSVIKSLSYCQFISNC